MRLIVLLLLSCIQFDSHPFDARVAQAEGELSETYQILWARAGEDHKALLERAQVAWFHYRQAQCEMWAAAEVQAECLAEMTDQRTRELRGVGLDRYERSYYSVRP
jgi:uncharacterized protein YecT (DUF1311 family)